MTFELKEKSEVKDTIENDYIKASFSRFGGEMYYLLSKKTGIQYMHEPAPGYWDRTSPILFPIVGCVSNNKIKCDDVEYTMYLHGFAHFQNFDLVYNNGDSLMYVLESNGRFRDVYPFEFKLYLMYSLNENGITCGFKVENIDDKEIHFSIGAHPAFKCPIDENDRNDYYIKFHGADKLNRGLIDMSCGLLFEEGEEIMLENGELRFDEHLFDRDAFVIENNQTQKVSILKPDKTPYITVSFDAPLFGVWTQGDKKAPFLCIEPWYGRCDSKGYDGEFKDKKWVNKIVPNEVFEKTYTIELL